MQRRSSYPTLFLCVRSAPSTHPLSVSAGLSLLEYSVHFDKSKQLRMRFDVNGGSVAVTV